MAEELRKPPVLCEHDSTLGRYFGGPVRIKIQFDTTGESVYI